MQIHLSMSNMPFHFPHRHRRLLIACTAVAAPAAAAQALFKLQPDSISAASILFLTLMLLGALGAGREFLTPSLKELAFYFFAIVAAALIWPAAHLAVSAYEAAGFVTLALFMAFVFALAVALGVLSVKLLASHDGEK